MNARDELAELAYLSMYPKTADANRIQPLRERDAWEIEMHERVAESILAAGYRKPRTITTAEELDALPYGSVVLDNYRATATKLNADYWEIAGFSSRFRVEAIDLPATVLHEPSA